MSDSHEFNVDVVKLCLFLGTIDTNNAMLDGNRVKNIFNKLNAILDKYNSDYIPNEKDKIVMHYFANTFAPIFEDVIKDAQRLNLAMDEFETNCLFADIFEEEPDV